MATRTRNLIRSLTDRAAAMEAQFQALSNRVMAFADQLTKIGGLTRESSTHIDELRDRSAENEQQLLALVTKADGHSTDLAAMNVRLDGIDGRFDQVMAKLTELVNEGQAKVVADAVAPLVADGGLLPPPPGPDHENRPAEPENHLLARGNPQDLMPHLDSRSSTVPPGLPPTAALSNQPAVRSLSAVSSDPSSNSARSSAANLSNPTLLEKDSTESSTSSQRPRRRISIPRVSIRHPMYLPLRPGHRKLLSDGVGQAFPPSRNLVRDLVNWMIAMENLGRIKHVVDNILELTKVLKRMRVIVVADVQEVEGLKYLQAQGFKGRIRIRPKHCALAELQHLRRQIRGLGFQLAPGGPRWERTG